MRLVDLLACFCALQASRSPDAPSLSACTRLVYPHPVDHSPVELHTREELTGLCQRTVMIDYGNREPIGPPAPGTLKTAFYVQEKDCLEVRRYT